MLRGLVLILVLANAAYLAWTQGWIDGVAGGAQGDREPQRLSNQVRPEIVRILPPSAAGSGAAGVTGSSSAGEPGGAPSASGPNGGLARSTAARLGPTEAGTSVGRLEAGSDSSGALAGAAAGSLVAASALRPAGVAGSVACLEAGPFSALQLVAAQSSLRAAAVEPVAEVATESAGAWMVYMGRYVTAEAMRRKVEELRRRRLDFEEVKGLPDLEPGLSLGRFGSRQAADEALAQVARRNVRTARVVSVAPAATLHWLRLADATPARQQQLLALKAPALGEGFAACGTSPAAQALRQPSPASAPASPGASSVAANAP